MARPSPAGKKTVPVSFVFGSSTPREFSHHVNECAKKGLKAKLDQGGDDIVKRRGDITYYMRQAKSTDAKEGRSGGGRSRAATAYAFGSSTPRSLSHMSKVPREQRVYDAKLAKDQQQRASAATMAAPLGTMRASATNPHMANRRWVSGGADRSISTESRNEADEAASEPDIVQDRLIDFGRHSGSTKRMAADGTTPKRGDGSTTKTTEDSDNSRGRAKAKHSTGSAAGASGGGPSVPAGQNIRHKTSSTTQQQKEQKGNSEMGGEEREKGEGGKEQKGEKEAAPAKREKEVENAGAVERQQQQQEEAVQQQKLTNNNDNKGNNTKNGKTEGEQKGKNDANGGEEKGGQMEEKGSERAKETQGGEAKGGGAGRAQNEREEQH